MAVLRRHLGLPGALMGELAEHSGDLLAEHGLRRGVSRGVMGKLVERAGDLLLVLRGELLRCHERLAETLLLQALIAVALPLVTVTRLSRVAAEPGAAIALARLSEWTLSELALSKLTDACVAELGAEPLGSSVAAHHSGRPEDRGRQRLSEIRRMVSVRQ
jgi:hypothetical protein